MARRERNIYKRKDGRFEARYIKERDNQGKARYGAVYARTYAEVKAKLELAKSKANKNTPPLEAPAQSIVEKLENYLFNLRPHIKESTYGLYRRYIDKHLYPHFKDTPYSQLTFDMVQEFISKLIKNGLSVVTVQAVFNFLRSGVKKDFPPETFEVKFSKQFPYKIDVLSRDEQKQLEAVANSSDRINRISVILCLYTGIRIGELCGLLWRDIDFERGVLRVRRTLQRVTDTTGIKKTKVICLAPKSSSSHRDIPLPSFLIEILREHRNPDADSYVINAGSGYIEPRNIQRRFKKLLSTANIRYVNFHAGTRHTFATRALESGFDIKTLSEILGHASVTVTLSKYAHVLDEHKRRNMELLGELFG